MGIVFHWEAAECTVLADVEHILHNFIVVLVSAQHLSDSQFCRVEKGLVINIVYGEFQVLLTTPSAAAKASSDAWREYIRLSHTFGVVTNQADLTAQD